MSGPPMGGQGPPMGMNPQHMGMNPQMMPNPQMANQMGHQMPPQMMHQMHPGQMMPNINNPMSNQMNQPGMNQMMGNQGMPISMPNQPPMMNPNMMPQQPNPHQNPMMTQQQQMAAQQMNTQQQQPPQDQERVRFVAELEFVQCLANPNYICFLAQNGYFKKPEFINYMEYLKYWKKPEYAKLIRYPTCLRFLELVQDKKFREAISVGKHAKEIDDQIILAWTRRHRLRDTRIRTAMEKHEQNKNAPGDSKTQGGGTQATSSSTQQPQTIQGNAKS